MHNSSLRSRLYLLAIQTAIEDIIICIIIPIIIMSNYFKLSNNCIECNCYNILLGISVIAIGKIAVLLTSQITHR
jgi:hypothetical protein